MKTYQIIILEVLPTDDGEPPQPPFREVYKRIRELDSLEPIIREIDGIGKRVRRKKGQIPKG